MIARRLVSVGVSCASVLAIGLVYGQDNGATVSQASMLPLASMVQQVTQPDAAATLEITDIELTSALPIAPSAALTPVELATLEPIAIAYEAGGDLSLPKEEPAPAFACSVGFTAETVPFAMVNLELRAECLANERFTIHHNGMMFTHATDDTGAWSGTVPALNQAAVFMVSFANGEAGVATVIVPEAAEMERAVIQWSGYDGIGLHAREFGADYGDPGHLSASGPSVQVGAGQLLQIGDPAVPSAYLAQIYSLKAGPETAEGREGRIDLSVEVEVTRKNCGLDVEAQSIQVQPGQPMRVQDVILAMPECNAVGDFLVLNNLLSDLTLAAR